MNKYTIFFAKINTFVQYLRIFTSIEHKWTILIVNIYFIRTFSLQFLYELVFSQ